MTNFELSDIRRREFATRGISDAVRDEWLAAGIGPMSAIAYIDAGASIAEALHTRMLGLAPRELVAFATHGWRLADYLEEMSRRYEVSSWQLGSLFHRGYRPDDLFEAFSVGFTYDDLSLGDIGDYQRVLPLCGLGLSPAEVMAWAPTTLDITAECRRYADSTATSATGGEPSVVLKRFSRNHAVDVPDLLTLLSRGGHLFELATAFRAGSTVDLLLALPAEDPDDFTSSCDRDIGCVVSLLDSGLATDELLVLLHAGLNIGAIERVWSDSVGVTIDEVEWAIAVPDADDRAAWRRRGTSLEEAQRWWRFGVTPSELEGNVLTAAAEAKLRLVSAITRVGLDVDTDSPCVAQCSTATDGILTVTLYEDSDGFFTGRTVERTTTLEALLRNAMKLHVGFVDLGGLDSTEATQLLNLEPFLSIVRTMLDCRGDSDEDVVFVNGVELYFDGSHLIAREVEFDDDDRLDF